MNNLDVYDLEFIYKNCPEGEVPVFVIKGKLKEAVLHQKIKQIYLEVGNKLGRHIPWAPVTHKIIVDKAHKNDYVYAYYATPVERDLLRGEKHRLMNLNFREKISITTSCFAFNDQGESSDAFHIPLGKIKTTKDIDKIVNKIQRKKVSSIKTYVKLIQRDENDYVLTFSAFTPNSRKGYDIGKLKYAHACLQLELLKHFENYELELCDTDGNYYVADDMKTFVEEKRNSTNYYLRNQPKKMDEPSIDL